KRIGLFGTLSFAGVLVFVGGHPVTSGVVDSANQRLEVWPSIDLKRPYPPIRLLGFDDDSRRAHPWHRRSPSLLNNYRGIDVSEEPDIGRVLVSMCFVSVVGDPVVVG